MSKLRRHFKWKSFGVSERVSHKLHQIERYIFTYDFALRFSALKQYILNFIEDSQELAARTAPVGTGRLKRYSGHSRYWKGTSTD